MSLASHAALVSEFLTDSGHYDAEPDPRGPTFPGGILMVAGGERFAFFLPTDDLDGAMRSLRGHLEDIYPNGGAVGDPEEVVEGVISSRVELVDAEIAA